MSAELDLEFRAIREKLHAITVAEDLIYALERQNGISARESRTRLRELKQRRLRLEADRAALALTSSGSTSLTDADVTAFANDVRTLSVYNVEVEALKGAVVELFNLLRITSQA